MAVWLVADFEALSSLVTTIFDTSSAARIPTAPAINYTACYRLVFFVFSHFSINLLLRFCLPCIGFGGSFAIFGLSISSCELQMCYQIRCPIFSSHSLLSHNCNEFYFLHCQSFSLQRTIYTCRLSNKKS